MDGRAIFGHLGTVARRQSRSARSSHVSGGVREGDIPRAGALADAQPWQLEHSGPSEHDQPAPGPSGRSALDRSAPDGSGATLLCMGLFSIFWLAAGQGDPARAIFCCDPGYSCAAADHQSKAVFLQLTVMDDPATPLI